MKFGRYNPAQLEGARLATEGGLGYCYTLSEHIRLAAEAVAKNMTDAERQAVADGLLRVPFVDDVFKATRRTARHLSPDEAIEFIARPVYIVGGHLPVRPKAKKTRLQFSSEIRRGVYHTLVRLPAVRLKAKATRRQTGAQSRKTVYPLIREALKKGVSRRGVRAEVTRLAAFRGVRMVADWQLGRIIKEFFKVDTTA